MINIISPSANTTLPLESETHTTQIDQPLVDEVVDSIPSSIDPNLPLETKDKAAQVIFVTSDHSHQGGISRVPIEPTPSIEVFSF